MNIADLLEEMLREGVQALGEAFRAAQLAHVLGQQRPDGGFGGRRGGSDLYYTEFALRLLSLISQGDEPGVRDVRAHAARYLNTRPPPTELVDIFSLLNARRLLERQGLAVTVDEAHCRAAIQRQHREEGGYGLRGGMAYGTFLAALSLRLLGQDEPLTAADVAAVAALQQPEGGFAQDPGGASQTNSTAAALAVLLMENALDEQAGQRAVEYLARQQHPSGGFRSHDGAPPELLSTFTALSTLAFLDHGANVDLANIARFVKSCTNSSGGFGAHAADPEVDVEYTYYGTGTLALLALWA